MKLLQRQLPHLRSTHSPALLLSNPFVGQCKGSRLARQVTRFWTQQYHCKASCRCYIDMPALMSLQTCCLVTSPRSRNGQMGTSCVKPPQTIRLVCEYICTANNALTLSTACTGREPAPQAVLHLLFGQDVFISKNSISACIMTVGTANIFIKAFQVHQERAAAFPRQRMCSSSKAHCCSFSLFFKHQLIRHQHYKNILI